MQDQPGRSASFCAREDVCLCRMWEAAQAQALSTLYHVLLHAGFRPYLFPVTTITSSPMAFSTPSVCLRDQTPTRQRPHFHPGFY